MYYAPDTETVSFALCRNSQAKEIADIFCDALVNTDISSVPTYKLHRNENGMIAVTIQDKNLMKSLAAMSSPEQRISALLKKIHSVLNDSHPKRLSKGQKRA